MREEGRHSGGGSGVGRVAPWGGWSNEHTHTHKANIDMAHKNNVCHPEKESELQGRTGIRGVGVNLWFSYSSSFS